MTSADAPATTPRPSDTPARQLVDELVDELAAAIVDAEDFDLADAEAAAEAALVYLSARADDAAAPVPDWYVRLDGLTDSDAFPMQVREDVASALRLLGELHLISTHARRERDAALRGAERALLDAKGSRDSLALALLMADDSLTPQHPAEEVAALKEVAKAARDVVNWTDDVADGTVGSGDQVMMRLAQSLGAVEA